MLSKIKTMVEYLVHVPVSYPYGIVLGPTSNVN